MRRHALSNASVPRGFANVCDRRRRAVGVHANKTRCYVCIELLHCYGRTETTLFHAINKLRLQKGSQPKLSAPTLRNLEPT